MRPSFAQAPHLPLPPSFPAPETVTISLQEFLTHEHCPSLCLHLLSFVWGMLFLRKNSEGPSGAHLRGHAGKWVALVYSVRRRTWLSAAPPPPQARALPRNPDLSLWGPYPAAIRMQSSAGWAQHREDCTEGFTGTASPAHGSQALTL